MGAETEQKKLPLEGGTLEETSEPKSVEKESGSKLWVFLNTAFGIWLVSGLGVGLITWTFATWRDARSTAAAKRTEIQRLDTEIGARLRQGYGALAQLVKEDDDFGQRFARMTLGWSIGGLPSPMGDSSIYPEFRGRSLLSLVTALRGLVPDSEQAALLPALVEAELLNSSLTDSFTSGMSDTPGSMFGIEPDDRPADPLQRVAYSLASLLRHPRWSISGQQGIASLRRVRREAIAGSIARAEKWSRLVHGPALDGGIDPWCDPCAPGAPPAVPAPPITEPPSGDLPDAVDSSKLLAVRSSGSAPDHGEEKATGRLLVTNEGKKKIKSGDVIVGYVSEHKSVVFYGVHRLNSLDAGEEREITVELQNVLSPFDPASIESRATMTPFAWPRQLEFEDGTFMDPSKTTPGGSMPAPSRVAPPQSAAAACGGCGVK